MKLTVVVDNFCQKQGLLAEWGLLFLAGNKRYQHSFGHSRNLPRANALT